MSNWCQRGKKISLLQHRYRIFHLSIIHWDSEVSTLLRNMEAPLMIVSAMSLEESHWINEKQRIIAGTITAFNQLIVWPSMRRVLSIFMERWGLNSGANPWIWSVKICQTRDLGHFWWTSLLCFLIYIYKREYLKNNIFRTQFSAYIIVIWNTISMRTFDKSSWFPYYINSTCY